jgi:DNA-binding MarR family transcriptional regulator
MKKIIEVLQLWAEYEKAHPNCEFEDFCRFYLAKPEIKAFKPPKSGPSPVDADGMFLMTVSRTTLAFWGYMRIALKETPMPSLESLMVCAALNSLGESRKIDIINYSMLEVSTGMDIINRLIRKGFIHQRTDPNDKRSRLLTLSEPGKNVLFGSFKKAALVREILLNDVPEDDKRLVTQILYPIQEKHSKLSVESKGKTIEEIHTLMFDKKGKI